MHTHYPVGTLLLREYRSVDDQGHVAMVCQNEKNDPLFDKIIHSCYTMEPSDGGVTITTLGRSHFAFTEGTYQYVVLPEDWIM